MNETPTQSPDQGPEHNPDGLTPEQYGAPVYRLLREGEKVAATDEIYDTRCQSNKWVACEFGNSWIQLEARHTTATYRRRVAPEPAAPTVHPDTVARFAEIDAAEQRIAELERNEHAIRVIVQAGDRPLADEVSSRMKHKRELQREVFALEKELAQLRAANAQLERELIIERGESAETSRILREQDEDVKRLTMERDEARAERNEVSLALVGAFEPPIGSNADAVRAIRAAYNHACKTASDLRAQLAASEKDRAELRQYKDRVQVIMPQIAELFGVVTPLQLIAEADNNEQDYFDLLIKVGRRFCAAMKEAK